MGKCKDCGAHIEINAKGLPNLPCDLCGGNSLLIEVADQVEIREMLGMNAKAIGQKKPFLEINSGDELRICKGDWVTKERRIDRQNDLYMERVVDGNGNVIHEVAERLSDHVDHGSARKRE